MLDNTRLLLPPNRTPLESAVVQALHSADHPEQTIGSLYRSIGDNAVSSELLPWLAWSQDVLAWPRNAPQTLRRQLTASSWRMHRQMGTLAGLREIAAVFGAQVSRVITPPAKAYAGQSLSTVERNAFVSKYPQLRIYPQRSGGQRIGAMLEHCFAGRAAYPVQTTAAMRLAPQAYLLREGIETPLQAIERELLSTERASQSVTEIRKPGRAGAVGFCGRTVRWLVASDAAGRIYRMRSTAPYREGLEVLRRVAVQPGLEPMDVRHDWIAERGMAKGVFAGRHTGGHLRRSTARDRIYKRLWLFDPSVDVARRGAMSFAGAARLGMPAHHAQLCMSIPGRTHPRVARLYVRGFLSTSDQSNYHEALASMRDVARASDRIAIDTAFTRPLAAGESVRAGSATAGDWRAS